MAKDKAIWVEGERELFANMQRRMDGSLKAAREGLQKAGLAIIADAVQNIRSNKSWTGGQLASSGRVQKVEGDDDALDVGFFSSDTTGGYAAYVEYGTRGGGKRTIKSMMPRIIQWLRKKGMFGADGNAKAFFISRKIVRQGTKPHPFFRPAVEKHEKEVKEAIKQAVKESIK